MQLCSEEFNLSVRDSAETLVTPVRDNNFLSEDGIQLATGLRVNMKNKLIPYYDRIISFDSLYTPHV